VTHEDRDILLREELSRLSALGGLCITCDDLLAKY